MLKKIYSNFMISVVVCIFTFISCSWQYTVPSPTIEILLTRGFRISIPDEPGISSCKFYYKINSDKYSESMTTFGVNDGKWIFENRIEILEPGQGIIYRIDVIYYNILYYTERFTHIPYDLGTDFMYLHSENRSIYMLDNGFRIVYPEQPNITFFELTGIVYNDDLDYIFNIKNITGRVHRGKKIYKIKTPKSKYYTLCFYTLFYWIRVFYNNLEYRIHHSVSYYCVPKVLTSTPSVEILPDRGFRVSITDNNTEKSVTGLRGIIHRGNKNLEKVNLELVDDDDDDNDDNKIIYENQEQKINPGSTFAYTVFITRNGTTIYEKNSIFLPYESNTTEIYFNEDLETIVISNEYSVPIPILESISSEGFNLSIADEAGMSDIELHCGINQNLEINPNLTYHSSITKDTQNNRWLYQHLNITLNAFDRLYYWIRVKYNGREYISSHNSIFIPYKTDVSVRKISSSLASEKENPIENQNIECTLSKTTVNGHPVCSQKLIFEENFEFIAWKKWQRVIQISSGSDDSEFVLFKDYPENFYIRNQRLHIVPTLLQNVPGFNHTTIRNGILDLKAKCTSNVEIDTTCKRQAKFAAILPPVVSAKLRTKHFFSFRYGKVEIRAKLPIGDWIFPQLFLQPLDNHYGNEGYASGQLRIAFIRGNLVLKTGNGEDISGKKLFGGAVLATGETLREAWLGNITQNEHFGNRFHNYTMIWNDDEITAAVDGITYTTLKNDFKILHELNNITYAKNWKFGEKMTPFDKEFYVELGVSVGGMSDFPDGSYSGILGNKLKPWTNFDPKSELKFYEDINNWYQNWFNHKSKLVVDYVRVWAL